MTRKEEKRKRKQNNENDKTKNQTNKQAHHIFFGCFRSI